MNCGTVSTQLTPNHTNLTLSNQISSVVATTYKGLSLIIHVFGEAVVWFSVFRLQRLCAQWRHEEVEDGNLITEHQAWAQFY